MPGRALLRIHSRRRRSALVATLHDALTAVAPEIVMKTTGTTATKTSRRTRTERPTNPQHHPPLSSPATTKCPFPPSSSSSSAAAASLSPTRHREDTKVATTPSMIDEPMDNNYVVDTSTTCRYRMLLPLPTVAGNEERNDKNNKRPQLIAKRHTTRSFKRVACTPPPPPTIHKVAFQSKRKITRSSSIQANTANVRKLVDTVMDTTQATTATATASTAVAHHIIVTDDSSWSDTNYDRAVKATRKRIPTNFYHATVSTTTTNTTITTQYHHHRRHHRVSRTNHHGQPSNINNDIVLTINNHNIAHITQPTTARPQRKRIPTDFFRPSTASPVVPPIRTRSVRPPEEPVVPISIRSVVTTCVPSSSPSPTAAAAAAAAAKRPRRTEPDETCGGTSSSTRLDNAVLPMTHIAESTGVSVRSHMCDNDDMPPPPPGGNLSFPILLADYQEHVAMGCCHPISFGKTLSSAVLAIDRKIQSLKGQRQYQLDCQNSENDKEVAADLREYKRSLRAFSVYEDREKLASIQEVQESLEFWGRYYATTTVPLKRYQKCDPTWDHHGSSINKSSNRQNDGRMVELSLLEKRPIVISSGVRMMSRSAFKCSNDANCIYGCQRKSMNDTKVWTANTVMAPVPLIQPFCIDDNEMDDDACTVTKTKRTIDTLLELQSSLRFMATYQDTAEKFTSLE